MLELFKRTKSQYVPAIKAGDITSELMEVAFSHFGKFFSVDTKALHSAEPDLAKAIKMLKNVHKQKKESRDSFWCEGNRVAKLQNNILFLCNLHGTPKGSKVPIGIDTLQKWFPLP